MYGSSKGFFFLAKYEENKFLTFVAKVMIFFVTWRLLFVRTCDYLKMSVAVTKDCDHKYINLELSKLRVLIG